MIQFTTGISFGVFLLFWSRRKYTADGIVVIKNGLNKQSVSLKCVAARNASETKSATEPGDADQGAFVDRSSILRASTTRNEQVDIRVCLLFCCIRGDHLSLRLDMGHCRDSAFSARRMGICQIRRETRPDSAISGTTTREG